MTSTLLLAIVLNAPTPIADYARDHPVIVLVQDRGDEDSAPHQTNRDRWQQGLMFASVAASGVAAGVTAACIAEGSCREVFAIARRLYGKSVVYGTLFKVAVMNGFHYLVWRLPAPTKRLQNFKTVIITGIAAWNVGDMSWDLYQVNKIVKQRAR